MGRKTGVQTGKFGEWLTWYIESVQKQNQYIVFYDHGDSDSNVNVHKISGFFGDRISNHNHLTDADIMIADNNHEIT